ncbi:hypothetical protein FB451DRAFT_1375251, partial [Mycena latifolia]
MSGGSGSGSGATGRYGLCQVCPEDCEAGLAAVKKANETSQLGSLPLGSLVFDIELDGVDISMPFFRDCLSDAPVDGADNIKSISTWAVAIGKKAQHVCKHVYKRACLQTRFVNR